VGGHGGNAIHYTKLYPAFGASFFPCPPTPPFRRIQPYFGVLFLRNVSTTVSTVATFLSIME